MFAVIKTGGKQYKVASGDILKVEKLAADSGEMVQFNDILMLGGDTVSVGAPFIEGAGVQAEVLEQLKGPKVISFKKRRRKHSSQRKKGHRQHLTSILVTDILAKGADKSGVKAAIGAASGVVAEAAPKKAAKKAAPKAEAPKAEAAPAGNAPKNLLTEAKGEADDLKKIGGVGPKLEKMLNEAGVYHFWQIAEWSAEDVAYMDDKLSFKGRIERDDWIKQATDFAAEK
jgi:large subunit ribosomal protein L21